MLSHNEVTGVAADAAAGCIGSASQQESAPTVTVDSRNVEYRADTITARYGYTVAKVTSDPAISGAVRVREETSEYLFSTKRNVSRLGLMLVGWGGNNGSTLTAAILANKHNLSWETREGRQHANYFGSFVMSGTLKLGTHEASKDEVYVPVRNLVPMVHPNDIVVGGWDISGVNLADAAARARVLEPDLRRQVHDEMAKLVPLRSLYYPDFIAGNQSERADNVIPGLDKTEHLALLRKDIRDFKETHSLDKVVVMWTASTERYCVETVGVHDTPENLLNAINASHAEISPSIMFAVAAILEGCCFINGSPQRTLVPGVTMLANMHNVFVAGDDFKSGQTKVKSVLADFLVGAGLRPLAITSYNHLGNNDGKNLSQHEQFRSKEISKSSVVDDVVKSNRILFPDPERDAPDHTVVIKYVPSLGDSKRALDEYYTEIFMGGRNTMSITNICEDSLLASPLIIDLAILCELFTRVSVQRVKSSGDNNAETAVSPALFDAVLSPLAYFLKAPVVPAGAPIINTLARQRACIEALLRALVGLAPNNESGLEWIVADKKAGQL